MKKNRAKKIERLFISKDDLRLFVNNLKKDSDEFIAPKYEHLDDIVFGDTKQRDGELLNYDGNSVVSPRAFMLPQTEVLFEIESAKRNVLNPIEDKRKRIFYGVRPCDIIAISLMRHFFLDEFVDRFYEEKLTRSTFIALACTKPCSSNSFCYEMDAGPVAKEGFDLQLTPVSRGYLVDIGTKKGKAMASKNRKLFTLAKAADQKESLEQLRNFAKGTKKVDYRKIAKIMRDDKVKNDIWDDIGIRCVVCSGCITLCPTCSCFSVVDRITGDRGLRMRYCDGCPYAGFTRMSGGSTPFALHKDHIRRFFEHKLNVDVYRYGRPSCVGCSRCIQTCPGNISIVKFIKDVVKDEKIK